MSGEKGRSEKNRGGQFFYNIHNLVSITANFRLKMIPDYFLVDSEDDYRGPRFEVVATRSDSIGDGHEWSYSYHPFRGTLTKVGINLLGDSVSLRFYDTAYRYLNDLRYPISQLIGGLMQFQLLRRGYLLVHGACLSDSEGNGIALVGLSNVGKTTTAIRLVLSHGFRFLADDMFITDGNTGLCFPRTLRLENFGDIGLFPEQKLSSVKRMLWGAASHIPLLPEVWMRPFNVTPTGAFQPSSSAKMQKVFFLHRKRGQGEIHPIDKEEAFRQLVIQHRIGTVDYDFAASRLFHMFSFENREVKFTEFLSEQTNVLHRLVQNCLCYEVLKETPYFEEEILKEATAIRSNQNKNSSKLS